MLVRTGNVPTSTDRFEAMIVWMSEQPMVPGKSYWIKHSSKLLTGAISTLRYQIDVNTLHRQQTPTLGLNEIGRCSLSLNQTVAIDAYRRNRSTGAFAIIDRLTNVTIGAGMILDRSTGDRADHWDAEASPSLQAGSSPVTPAERISRFGQQATTLLLTGLSGAGKTTIAYALERRLFDDGRCVSVLDGQNMRLGISKDLGFSAAERSENLRRSSEVAKLLNDGGMICICSFVAPDEAVRNKVADVIGRERLLVVHLDAPVEICREPAGRAVSHLHQRGP